MGICGSTGSSVSDEEREEKIRRSSDLFDLIINPKSPHIRLDAADAMKKFAIEGQAYSYNVSYCYVSQRGYYPNALGKANQDSYVICENILGDKNTHLFGVFDGHGEYGDECSFYAAEQFANIFAKDLKSASGGVNVMDGSKMNALYTNAFVKVNKALHKSKIDDSLSGTTGVTVVLKGDCLHIANVGDSRAIIASESGDTVKFSALSSDQTPFRKDERDRLRLKGAQIMTLDQIEGNEPLHDNWGAETGEEIDEVGDPPRVWDGTLERPGCAFTRSIGDAIAEKVGVHAEPEIMTWKLSPGDRMAIIASDGVFEFLTSQAVVDMILKFKNPLDAAKHVVAEAYRLWLTYDDRTDDITIIIMVFDSFTKRDPDAAISDRSAAMVKAGALLADVKPIRNVVSKAKRRVISENFSADDNVEFDFEAHATSKTEEELRRLNEMVSPNFMFQHLTDHQKSQVFKVMNLKVVKAGDIIIREGDVGDELYIIDNGEFTVHKKDSNGNSQLVFTYTTVGAAFGELSLMYGKPRAASVIALTDGRLWSVSRLAFRASLMKKQQVGMMKTLRAIPVLNTLKITQLQRICERTNEQVFKENEVIFKEGEIVPWALCVILSGGVRTKGKTAGKKEKNRKEGSYIGKPECGTVVMEATADEKTTCAFVPMDVFADVVGSDAQSILNATSSKTNRGAPLAKQISVFGTSTKGRSSSSKSVLDYKVDKAIMVIGGGSFSYLGSCTNKAKIPYSVKVISKKAAVDAHRAQKLASELKYLTAMGEDNECKFIPTVLATCQDAKVVMLVYDDNFVGDLAMCLGAGVDDRTKLYYSACIYSAVSFLHEFGLMHRYVNTESVYVTTAGVPKLTDLRNAKRMEGSKVFTVCGDPLYFAPEIITQQGYDYACDLWALGCLIYEMYEERTPFGDDKTEETVLFKAIANFKAGTLLYSDKTPEPARDLINQLIHPDGPSRIGYQLSENIKKVDYFEEIQWEQLFDDMQKKSSAQLSQATADLGHTIFSDGELRMEECNDSVFEEF